MIKPAFIVEGDLEKLFIEQSCPGSPVRKIGCNGDTVKISEIARRVGTHARMLQKKCNLIVVIFDREARSQSAIDLESEFLAELAKENIDKTTVVGISDRQIENWILADWDNFCKASGAQSNPRKVTEGTKGKSMLKALLPDGLKYVETLQGVKWLKQMDSLKIAENSPSFERFAGKLRKMQCWWLNKERLESTTIAECQ